MEDFTGLLISLLLGFIPMFFFAYFIYWTDRYEKEPLHLLGGAFLWGAIVAAGAAYFVNTMLGIGIYLFTRSNLATELTTGAFIAPLVEEFLKGMAVFIIFLAFRTEFDTILDGIVYAAIVALGFAATENAYYIYTLGFQENGIPGALFMVYIRVLLVGWQHPFYTAFIGIGLAIARLSRHQRLKIIAPLSGFSVAVLSHAFHNILASLLPGTVSMTLGTFIDWSGWFLMLIFIIWAIYRENRWIVEQLREEVGLQVITNEQYQTACSTGAQARARLRSIAKGNFKHTTKFYQTCAELSFKKHQLTSFGEEQGNSGIIQQLRTELVRLSPRTSA